MMAGEAKMTTIAKIILEAIRPKLEMMTVAHGVMTLTVLVKIGVHKAAHVLTRTNQNPVLQMLATTTAPTLRMKSYRVQTVKPREAQAIKLRIPIGELGAQIVEMLVVRIGKRL